MNRFAIVLCVLLMIATSSCGMRNEDPVASAAQAFAQGKYRLSIIRLKNHLLNHPDDVEARILLGKAYLRSGQAGWAEKELRAAIKRGADSSDIRLLLARALGSQRKYAQLLELLEDFDPEDPDEEHEAHLLRAKAWLAKKHPERAISEFNKALAIREDAGTLTGLARAYLADGRIKRAREILQRLDREGEESPDFLVLKARFMQKTGRFDEAVKIYERLLTRIGRRADSVSFRVYTGLISVYLDRRQYERARKILEKMRTVFRRHLLVDYIDTLISVYERRYEDALEKGLKLYARLPDNRSILALLGYSNYVLGNYEQANMYVTHLLTRDPENIEILHLLAKIRKKLDAGDRDELDYASEIVDASSTSGSQASLLARLSMSLGRYDDAVKYLEEAIRKSTDQASRKRYETDLAGTYLLSGDPARAIEVLEKRKSTDSDDVSLAREMIYIAAYMKLGEESRALQRIRRLEKSGLDAMLVNRLRIYVYLKQGKSKEAVRLLRDALQKDPDDLFSLKLLTSLYVRSGETDKAISMLEARLVRRPADLDSALLLSALHVRNRNLQRAGEILDHVIQESPSRIRARIARSEIHLMEGDAEAAVRVLESLPQDVEWTSDYAMALAKAYLKARDRVKAREILLALPESQRTRPDVALFLSSLLADEGKPDEAASILLASLVGSRDVRLIPYAADVLSRMEPRVVTERLGQLEQDPGLRELTVRLRAEYHLRRKEPDQASAVLHGLIQTDDSPELLYQYARAMLMAGKVPAPELVDRKMVAGIERLPHLLRLAELYSWNGLKRRALELYREAVRLDGENVAALNNASYLCLELGEPCGHEYAARALSLMPDNVDVMDTYAWALYQEKRDFSKARQLLEEALQKRPEDSWIRFHYARVLAAVGERARSRTILERLRREPTVDENLRRRVQQALEKAETAG